MEILYSFILYTTILLASEEITEDEMSFFISGGFALREPVAKNPASDWLPEKSWGEVSRIGKILPAFAGFMQSFRDNLLSWKEYYDVLDPINLLLPQPWETTLTSFQKLLIAKMIKSDSVPIMIHRFVETGMGLSFVVPPPFNISNSYADSNCLMPLIFILSIGSDPMATLTKFVESMNYLDRFESISLGQGQGPIAQKMIERAQADGSWVCLQNCHLAISWMPNLEKICENLDHTNTMSNFRLWLTSYPSNQFPVSVLQNSVKMTKEPPIGLQNNIMRSYLAEGMKEVEFLEKDPTKKRTYSRLVYALCFFHAVIQERRNYGPQGWNIRYDFNESDLQISIQQFELFVQNYEQIPFDAITYLIGECNYGGRVTDERDRRCLITILKDFFNPDIITNLNYSFVDIGPEYTIPKKHNYEDYVKQIELIPLNPSPEVFGLHVNASIIRNLELAANLFNSLTLVQGAIIMGDISKQDEILINMKEDIYKKIPDLFNIEEALKYYPIVYLESMNTVIIQELERYNNLLAEIRNSLIILEKAVKGLVMMTPLLEVISAQPNTSAIDGAYAYGMYLAGARWEFKQMLLAESYPKILWDPMPIVLIKPLEKMFILIGNRYECPLYITSARFGVLKTTGHSSNYIMSILLSTDRPVSHWIKRGLALLCQLDD
ncbi:PREDICTED: dynein heavy chain 12, axonemal-like [Wasmannia auropunctata]|uniref:dynein heavy chain 12, axonemal-like n=1 Tax=Wasmannia auropunctata TaxID=64793 RepID=UPI0005ED514C|nr:PREDICTED: dynein heavy chain 12, axonemal-like [Wasmannia auropunctata]